MKCYDFRETIQDCYLVLMSGNVPKVYIGLHVRYNEWTGAKQAAHRETEYNPILGPLIIAEATLMEKYFVK